MRRHGAWCYRPPVDTTSSVRHNISVEYVGPSWTAAARKHRESREQVRHVVGHAGLFFAQAASPPGRPDEALLLLGDDPIGTPLEIVGVELADVRLRIIHAMPMRPN